MENAVIHISITGDSKGLDEAFNLSQRSAKNFASGISETFKNIVKTSGLNAMNDSVKILQESAKQARASMQSLGDFSAQKSIDKLINLNNWVKTLNSSLETAVSRMEALGKMSGNVTASAARASNSRAPSTSTSTSSRSNDHTRSNPITVTQGDSVYQRQYGPFGMNPTELAKAWESYNKGTVEATTNTDKFNDRMQSLLTSERQQQAVSKANKEENTKGFQLLTREAISYQNIQEGMTFSIKKQTALHQAQNQVVLDGIAKRTQASKVYTNSLIEMSQADIKAAQAQTRSANGGLGRASQIIGAVKGDALYADQVKIANAMESVINKVGVFRGRVKESFSSAKTSTEGFFKKVQTLGSALEAEGNKTKSKLGSIFSGVFFGNLAANAIGGFSHAVKEATVDAVLYAARTQELGVVLQSLAKQNNISTETITEQEVAIKSLNITTQDARETLAKFINVGFDLEKAAPLARVAQDLGVISGRNTSEELEKLTQGILTLQSRTLRSAGVYINVTETIDRLAASTGRAVSSFSTLEKQNAILDASLDYGSKVAGSYNAAMTTASKQMRSLDRQWKEAQNSLGQAFIPALADAVTVAGFLLDKMAKYPDIFVQAAETVGLLTTALIAFRTQAVQGAVFGAVSLAAGVVDTFKGTGLKGGQSAAQLATVEKQTQLEITVAENEALRLRLLEERESLILNGKITASKEEQLALQLKAADKRILNAQTGLNAIPVETTANKIAKTVGNIALIGAVLQTVYEIGKGVYDAKTALYDVKGQDINNIKREAETLNDLRKQQNNSLDTEEQQRKVITELQRSGLTVAQAELQILDQKATLLEKQIKLHEIVNQAIREGSEKQKADILASSQNLFEAFDNLKKTKESDITTSRGYINRTTGAGYGGLAEKGGYVLNPAVGAISSYILNRNLGKDAQQKAAEDAAEAVGKFNTTVKDSIELSKAYGLTLDQLTDVYVKIKYQGHDLTEQQQKDLEEYKQAVAEAAHVAQEAFKSKRLNLPSNTSERIGTLYSQYTKEQTSPEAIAARQKFIEQTQATSESYEQQQEDIKRYDSTIIESYAKREDVRKDYIQALLTDSAKLELAGQSLTYDQKIEAINNSIENFTAKDPQFANAILYQKDTYDQLTKFVEAYIDATNTANDGIERQIALIKSWGEYSKFFRQDATAVDETARGGRYDRVTSLGKSYQQKASELGISSTDIANTIANVNDQDIDTQRRTFEWLNKQVDARLKARDIEKESVDLHNTELQNLLASNALSQKFLDANTQLRDLDQERQQLKNDDLQKLQRQVAVEQAVVERTKARLQIETDIAVLKVTSTLPAINAELLAEKAVLQSVQDRKQAEQQLTADIAVEIDKRTRFSLDSQKEQNRIAAETFLGAQRDERSQAEEAYKNIYGLQLALGNTDAFTNNPLIQEAMKQSEKMQDIEKQGGLQVVKIDEGNKIAQTTQNLIQQGVNLQGQLNQNILALLQNAQNNSPANGFNGNYTATNGGAPSGSLTDRFKLAMGQFTQAGVNYNSARFLAALTASEHGGNGVYVYGDRYNTNDRRHPGTYMGYRWSGNARTGPRGQGSSAAGNLQITLSTWNDAIKAGVIPKNADFNDLRNQAAVAMWRMNLDNPNNSRLVAQGNYSEALRLGASQAWASSPYSTLKGSHQPLEVFNNLLGGNISIGATTNIVNAIRKANAKKGKNKDGIYEYYEVTKPVVTPELLAKGDLSKEIGDRLHSLDIEEATLGLKEQEFYAKQLKDIQRREAINKYRQELVDSSTGVTRDRSATESAILTDRLTKLKDRTSTQFGDAVASARVDRLNEEINLENDQIKLEEELYYRRFEGSRRAEIEEKKFNQEIVKGYLAIEDGIEKEGRRKAYLQTNNSLLEIQRKLYADSLAKANDLTEQEKILGEQLNHVFSAENRNLVTQEHRNSLLQERYDLETEILKIQAQSMNIEEQRTNTSIALAVNYLKINNDTVNSETQRRDLLIQQQELEKKIQDLSSNVNSDLVVRNSVQSHILDQMKSDAEISAQVWNDSFDAVSGGFGKLVDKMTAKMGIFGQVTGNLLKNIFNRTVGGIFNSILDSVIPKDPALTKAKNDASTLANTIQDSGVPQSLAGLANVSTATIAAIGALQQATAIAAQSIISTATQLVSTVVGMQQAASAGVGGTAKGGITGLFPSITGYLGGAGGGSGQNSLFSQITSLGQAGIGTIGQNSASTNSALAGLLGTARTASGNASGGLGVFGGFGSGTVAGAVPSFGGGLGGILSSVLGGGGKGISGILPNLAGTGLKLLNAAPLLGMSLGGMLGGGSTSGQILGNAGGLLGGIAGLGLASALTGGAIGGGIFGTLSSAALAHTAGLGGGLLGGLGSVFVGAGHAAFGLAGTAAAAAGAALILAPIAIGLLVGAKLLARNKLRRQEEQQRSAILLDAKGKLQELLKGVQTDKVDGEEALTEASSIRQQYLDAVGQLKDKKTRNIAIATVRELDYIINQIKTAATAQKARKETNDKIVPTYATGGVASSQWIRVSRGEKLYSPAVVPMMSGAFTSAGIPGFASGGRTTRVSSNTVAPALMISGQFDRKDDILMNVPIGTVIATPQQQRVIDSSRGYASGGVVGQVASSAAHSVTVQPPAITVINVMSEEEATKLGGLIPDSVIVNKTRRHVKTEGAKGLAGDIINTFRN